MLKILLTIFSKYRSLRKKRDQLNQFLKTEIGLDFTSVLSLLFFIFGTIILFLCYYIFEKINSNEFVSGFILWFTAIVVLIYTKETHDLKEISNKDLREARKREDFEKMPFFRIQWSSNTNEVIQIINEGKGIALDLVFKPIIVYDQDIKSEFNIKSRPAFASKGVSVVSVDELWDGYKGFFERNRDNLRHFFEGWLKEKIEIQATYKDIIRRKYKVIFQSDISYNDKFRIVEQSLI